MENVEVLICGFLVGKSLQNWNAYEKKSVLNRLYDLLFDFLAWVFVLHCTITL